MDYQQFCISYGKPGSGEIPAGLKKMHDFAGIAFGKLLAIRPLPAKQTCTAFFGSAAVSVARTVGVRSGQNNYLPDWFVTAAA